LLRIGGIFQRKKEDVKEKGEPGKVIESGMKDRRERAPREIRRVNRIGTGVQVGRRSRGHPSVRKPVRECIREYHRAFKKNRLGAKREKGWIEIRGGVAGMGRSSKDERGERKL